MLRRVLSFVMAFAFVAGSATPASYSIPLLPTTAITVAVTGAVGDVIPLPPPDRVPSGELCAQGKFVYGSGGTTAKAWVQTSIDGGSTWIDIMSFAFLLASATKVSCVNLDTALGPAITPTDGTLTDNTILNGVLGDLLRVKLTTTGTYAATTVQVFVVPR